MRNIFRTIFFSGYSGYFLFVFSLHNVGYGEEGLSSCDAKIFNSPGTGQTSELALALRKKGTDEFFKNFTRPCRMEYFKFDSTYENDEEMRDAVADFLTSVYNSGITDSHRKDNFIRVLKAYKKIEKKDYKINVEECEKYLTQGLESRATHSVPHAVPSDLSGREGVADWAELATVNAESKIEKVQLDPVAVSASGNATVSRWPSEPNGGQIATKGLSFQGEVVQNTGKSDGPPMEILNREYFPPAKVPNYGQNRPPGSSAIREAYSGELSEAEKKWPDEIRSVANDTSYETAMQLIRNDIPKSSVLNEIPSRLRGNGFAARMACLNEKSNVEVSDGGTLYKVNCLSSMKSFVVSDLNNNFIKVMKEHGFVNLLNSNCSNRIKSVIDAPKGSILVYSKNNQQYAEVKANWGDDSQYFSETLRDRPLSKIDPNLRLVGVLHNSRSCN